MRSNKNERRLHKLSPYPPVTHQPALTPTALPRLPSDPTEQPRTQWQQASVLLSDNRHPIQHPHDTRHSTTVSSPSPHPQHRGGHRTAPGRSTCPSKLRSKISPTSRRPTHPVNSFLDNPKATLLPPIILIPQFQYSIIFCKENIFFHFPYPVQPIKLILYVCLANLDFTKWLWG